MAGTRDAIELLVHDHREVEQLFQQYEQCIGDGNHDAGLKKDLIDRITTELSKHAAVEEQYLYPLTAEAIAGGAELSEHSLEEHQEMKEALAELEDMDTSLPAYDGKALALMAEVRHHVQEEEGEMFPALRAAVGDQRLREVGEKMEQAKRIAPTRPHPHAPSTPPVNKLAGPAAGLVDRLTGKG
jgi:hemerythrin superfamily protein